MSRPAWPLTRIANEFDVSRSTVLRAVKTGKLPNAFKDSTGKWKVPLDDVLAAGWKPRRTWTNRPDQQGVHPGHQGVHDLGHDIGHEQPDSDFSARSQLFTDLGHEQVDLGHRLAMVQAELEATKALLAAEKEHTATLKQTLRLLEAAPTPPSEQPPNPPRRSWWKRLWTSS